VPRMKASEDCFGAEIWKAWVFGSWRFVLNEVRAMKLQWVNK
jgi:hypothetical protein